jgi:hypothetical protein
VPDGVRGAALRAFAARRPQIAVADITADEVIGPGSKYPQRRLRFAHDRTTFEVLISVGIEGQDLRIRIDPPAAALELWRPGELIVRLTPDAEGVATAEDVEAGPVSVQRPASAEVAAVQTVWVTI